MSAFVLAVLLVPAAGAWGPAAPVSAPSVSDSLELLRMQASQAALQGSETDRLLRLLDDSDPAVRAEAARALRWHTHDSRVRGRLGRALGEAAEALAVRREAARSLSAVAGVDEDAREALLAAAGDRRSADALRSFAFKALYPAAAGDGEAREALLRAARDSGLSGAVRGGAAWALFNAVLHHEEAREALLGLAGGSGDGLLRVEAVKSLFLAAGDGEVRERLIRLAEREGDGRVRVAAILALSNALVHDDARRALERLSGRDAEPSLRPAAVRALQGADLELLRYFHVGYRQGGPYGPYVDPILAE